MRVPTRSYFSRRIFIRISLLGLHRSRKKFIVSSKFTAILPSVRVENYRNRRFTFISLFRNCEFSRQTPMRNDSERNRSPVRPATVQYDTCCQGRATAIYIDKVSRFFFPFSFLILNVVYWSTFL